MKPTVRYIIVFGAVALLVACQAMASDQPPLRARNRYLENIFYLRSEIPTANDCESLDTFAKERGGSPGKLLLNEKAASFFYGLIEGKARDIVGPVFGKNTAGGVEFLCGDKVLVVRAKKRAWVFIRTQGFDPDAKEQILSLFRLQP